MSASAVADAARPVAESESSPFGIVLLAGLTFCLSTVSLHTVHVLPVLKAVPLAAGEKPIGAYIASAGRISVPLVQSPPLLYEINILSLSPLETLSHLPMAENSYF